MPLGIGLDAEGRGTTSDSFFSVWEVTKSFGELRAVDGVSFDIEEGEIYGIAGPNGAGKTTLFNLLSGLPFHADSGQVTFRGRSIDSLPPHEIYRLGVARTFQQETAFDTLTVEQNVRVGAVYGLSGTRQQGSDAIAQALDLLDLTDSASQIAGVLPLYPKKRLMIASAIVSKPAILMLDEPGAGLNPLELDALDSLIVTLNRELGLTILIIEHVLSLLFAISSRIMVMDAGRTIAEGRPQQVANDASVIEAYIGKSGKAAIDAIGN